MSEQVKTCGRRDGQSQNQFIRGEGREECDVWRERERERDRAGRRGICVEGLWRNVSSWAGGMSWLYTNKRDPVVVRFVSVVSYRVMSCLLWVLCCDVAEERKKGSKEERKK